MARDVGTAAALIPPRPTLLKLQEAAAGCTACDLHKTGTQTVFGDGPRSAQVMLVGEQPGDKEEREKALQGLTSDLARVAEGLRGLG